MTLWRVEVMTMVSATLPSASLFPTFQGGYAGASYALVASDATNALVTLYVKVNIIHDREINGPSGMNRYITRMTAGTFNPAHNRPDPYDNVIFDSSGQFNADHTDNGALFLAGGLLAIEKDTVTGRVSFISQAGRWDTTNAFLGLSLTTQIRPLSIGLLLQAQDIPPASNFDQILTVDWAHIAGRKDGTTITGAAMSTADPGSWNAWTESQIFNAFFTQTFTQLATMEESKLDWPPDPVPSFGNVDDGWYREWTGGDITPAAAGRIDTAVMPDHDVLFGAWQMIANTLMMRRSHDHGSTWTEVEIGVGTPATSISVQCYASQVWVCYYDGSNIVTRKSLDLGVSWSAAVPVSITGTNPRLVISPEGLQFYFYLTGGSLVLSRSADFGATLLDLTPILITGSVTTQDFAGVWAADRSLVVSYIVSGNWVSKRSLDYGLTWALA